MTRCRPWRGQRRIATLMSSGLIGGLLMQWPLGKTDLFDRRTVFLPTFLPALVALAMVPLVKTGLTR